MFVKIVAAVLMVAICVGGVVGFAACTKKNLTDMISEIYGGDENMATGARFFDYFGKEMSTFLLSYRAERKRAFNSREANFVTVDLGEEKSFNTIVLSEKGSCVTRFAIYGSHNADTGFRVLYQNDTIDSYRLCYVGDVNYRYIRICVLESDGKYEVNGVRLYSKKSETAEQLKVVAYLVDNTFDEALDTQGFDALTHIILFNAAFFVNDSGDIGFFDEVGERTGIEHVQARTARLREAIGDRDIKIILDVGLRGTTFQKMLGGDITNMLTQIVSTVDALGCDGYDIDYEYPETESEIAAFNAFFPAAKRALGDRVFSAAISAWQTYIDDGVTSSLDMVQVMVYDCFDSRGYHSTFRAATDAMHGCVALGFAKSKLMLGLPFYSRPLNGDLYWGSYINVADKLGYSENLYRHAYTGRENAPIASYEYYNSAQLISDKTAFALDYGIGGVMLWHYATDLPYGEELSLLRAINRTKQEKQA